MLSITYSGHKAMMLVWIDLIDGYSIDWSQKGLQMGKFKAFFVVCVGGQWIMSSFAG